MDFLHKHAGTRLLDKWRDPTPELRSGKSRDRAATSSRIEMVLKIDKKLFRSALDEDVDLAVAAEAPPRVETHYGRDAASQNFTRTQRDFFFDAAGAERTSGAAIFANQHPRAWPPIT